MKTPALCVLNFTHWSYFVEADVTIQTQKRVQVAASLKLQKINTDFPLATENSI